ncbi:hypothetical protein [Leifsonia sp. Leaf264]|uniref:hypothetical protein n=1 Tax=Leifsonia sp. Leaf264 TaxID=1736314 RepID=UPI0006F585D4|nr:hypothetical protein [Leifsonia sp. Leaf264]KQO98712.1 hypothetical protein ASF30_11660 [Leifsonia sp. Leaf264]
MSTTTVKPRGHVGVDGKFHKSKFTWKDQAQPEAGSFLVADEYTADYNVDDFHDRVAGKYIPEVTNLSEEERTFASAASAAVNGVWELEHLNEIEDLRKLGMQDDATFIEAKTYRDGDRLLVSVRHTDEAESPTGSLFVLNTDGSVSAYDDYSDNYGERWVEMAGYRGEQISQLMGAAQHGSVSEYI